MFQITRTATARIASIIVALSALVLVASAPSTAAAQTSLLGAELDACLFLPGCTGAFDVDPAFVTDPGTEFTATLAGGAWQTTVDFTATQVTVTFENLQSTPLALRSEDMEFVVLQWSGVPGRIIGLTEEPGNTLPSEACVESGTETIVPCLGFTDDSIQLGFGFDAANSPFPGHPGWFDLGPFETRSATFTIELEGALPTLAPGDLVVVERQGFEFQGDNAGGLLKVDPATGEQEVLVSGEFFSFPRALAIADDGDILVLNSGSDGLVRFDPDSGTVVPVASVSGTAMTLDTNGQLVVAGGPNVLSVDPDTGSSAVVGPNLQSVGGIAVDGTGDVFLLHRDSGTGLARLTRLDPSSGATTLVSEGALLGSGAGGGLVRTPTGDLFALTNAREVVKVDPATGTQTLVASGIGSSYARGLARESDGSLVEVGPILSSSDCDAIQSDLDQIAGHDQLAAELPGLRFTQPLKRPALQNA